MFSQNVFSARDVQMNSAINESNVWDSQPYSQVMYSSQNSQMSSVEMFSQQKGPSIPSKFDQYQRSQSQPTTEDEPPNYYSKYVNNPPLFPSKNNKLIRPMQAFIEDEKQSVSMKEERDMLQTFINLLKDYTKEVDSSFKTFKNDMENTLQAIAQNMQNGTQHIDEKVTNMKQELISILDTKDKELHEKQELNKNISEQSNTIKVLETKAGILEKQLDEMKNKESVYVDHKSKIQELEQKYLQCINQWNQDSCLRNTPPLSQQTDPLWGFQILPLHHKVDSVNSFPNGGPSSSTAGYGYNSWKPQTSNYYNPPRNNPLTNPNLHHASMMVPYASNPPYPNTAALQAKATSQTVTHNSLSYETPSRLNQSCSSTTENISSTYCSKACNTGSPAPRSCGLNISRRNTKRPKQSPIAMVKPQVRQHSPLMDDEIFLCGVVDAPETSRQMQNMDHFDEKDPFHTPYSGPFTSHVDSNDKKKSCRQEDTLRRKRSSISMLGIRTDDSEVQEITKALKDQTRRLSKRTKSLP